MSKANVTIARAAAPVATAAPVAPVAPVFTFVNASTGKAVGQRTTPADALATAKPEHVATANAWLMANPKAAPVLAVRVLATIGLSKKAIAGLCPALNANTISTQHYMITSGRIKLAK